MGTSKLQEKLKATQQKGQWSDEELQTQVQAFQMALDKAGYASVVVACEKDLDKYKTETAQNVAGGFFNGCHPAVIAGVFQGCNVLESNTKKEAIAQWADDNPSDDLAKLAKEVLKTIKHLDKDSKTA